MKALTLNKRQILYGFLIVTLGLSKSWLVTAGNVGSVDLAAKAEKKEAKPVVKDEVKEVKTDDSTIEETKEVSIDGKKYSFTVKVEKRSSLAINNFVNGSANKNEEKETIATFIDNSCDDCQISELPIPKDTQNALEKIISHYKKEKSLILTAAKEIAACVKTEDGQKIADHSKEKLMCLAKQISESSDDRETKKEKMMVITDDIQEQLNQSDSRSDRQKILSTIRAVKKEIGSNRDLTQDLKYLESGTKAIERIANLAFDSTIHTNNKLKNSLEIDGIASAYDVERNPYLQRYSEGTRAIIGDWSEVVLPLAADAQGNPNLVKLNCFGGNDFGGNDNLCFGGDTFGMPDTGNVNNINSGVNNNINNGANNGVTFGSRSQRVHVPYYPRTLNFGPVGNNQMSNNFCLSNPLDARCKNNNTFGSNYSQQVQPGNRGYLQGGIPQTRFRN